MRRLTGSAVMVLALLGASCSGGGDGGRGAATTAAGTTTAAAPGSTAASGATTPSTVASGPDGTLDVALVWHQHQPRYPVVDGVVTKPWVRAHAAKDYLDMAELAASVPGMKATFNLTPSLLLQIEEAANGRKDRYQVLTEIPADQLTADERAEVLKRFFDANQKVIGRFPRYQELAAKDRASFTVDDVRDLQVLWNLAWTDPSYLAQAPLKALVDKGRGFAESDKSVVLGEHLRIVKATIPRLAELWKRGKIELITTPLAHPILPLIADTDLARVSDPQAVLPTRFREYLDAQEHVTRGLAEFERLLGGKPAGMWPGEGSVAQDVVKLFTDAGVSWFATGEDVLARSLGSTSWERDASETVQDADALYRPYTARYSADTPAAAVFFRDTRLSDLIGFEYSGKPAQQAADDLIGRLQAIRSRLAAQDATGPHLVTILLDGENAWENYANDGIDFLKALYAGLTTTDGIRVTTPTEFLAQHADAAKPLANLYPGSWIGGTFTTWIGEPEEARAWELLRATRLDLRAAQQSGSIPADALGKAMEAMLWAEGSDWFWWYGSDQDSGDDGSFDVAYRELLGQVYDALGQPRPPRLAVPVIPATPQEGTTFTGAAGSVDVEITKDGVSLQMQPPQTGWSGAVDVYLGAPRSSAPVRGTTIDGRVLGFGATQTVRFDPAAGTACVWKVLPPVGSRDPITSCDPVTVSGTTAAVPLTLLGGLQVGDKLFVRMASAAALTPDSQPGAVVAPDVGGVDVIGAWSDPKGDDHGPGSYTYPTDAVFTPGSFDLTAFSWGTSGDDVVFTFDVAAPIANPWGSPNGLSIQTFDVYVDQDPGAGTGDRLLLAGRNAALESADGWDAAVVVEGWTPKVVRVGSDGKRQEDKPTIGVTVIAEKGRVIARVPKAALGLTADPSAWRLAVTLASQDGYPSAGVDRIRDVQPQAAQWRVGGGPSGAANATRLLDVLAPDTGTQEEALSSLPASGSGRAQGALTADDVATIGLAPAA